MTNLYHTICNSKIFLIALYIYSAILVYCIRFTYFILFNTPNYILKLLFIPQLEHDGKFISFVKVSIIDKSKKSINITNSIKFLVHNGKLHIQDVRYYFPTANLLELTYTINKKNIVTKIIQLETKQDIFNTTKCLFGVIEL